MLLRRIDNIPHYEDSHMETPQDPAIGSVHRELLLVVVNNPVAWKRKGFSPPLKHLDEAKVHKQIYLTTNFSISNRGLIEAQMKKPTLHTYAYKQNTILITKAPSI